MATIKTSRLIIEPLQKQDSKFILELLNTPGWLQFIGNRNIANETDAQNYIQKIQDNPNYAYFVFKQKENQTPLGIITLVKRDYLDHTDFGFSLLPQYEKQGFTLEASQAILHSLKENGIYSQLAAITLPENQKSITLLEKLDFIFEKEINENQETLLCYTLKLKS